MPTVRRWLVAGLFFGFLAASGIRGQEIPTTLEPWRDWATWDDRDQNSPLRYDGKGARIQFWPGELKLSAQTDSGSWQLSISVFSRCWVPIPGSAQYPPQDVQVEDRDAVVIFRDGIPHVRLEPGTYVLTGEFAWKRLPRRLAIPRHVGILSLQLHGQEVALPTWDETGAVWLEQGGVAEAEQEGLLVEVHRLLVDGIPLWLRTEVALTVSGKSREEMIGSILPAGWTLAEVESQIPVAIDDRGELKAQVRAGNWKIKLAAFRTTQISQVAFDENATPAVDVELIAFQNAPEFRSAEIMGLPRVDATQTTFPQAWRSFPIYRWEVEKSFRLDEKMRGMGIRRPEGLNIDRELWLDEDGSGLTYRDQITGNLQQMWRLDAQPQVTLGTVMSGGVGQLITKNPESGDAGVEIRDRNLQLEAVGRIEQIQSIPASGWQANAAQLQMTLNLPPGWRMFALLGADDVTGDWLTAWTLLDLFLLLVFSFALGRLWGWKTGLLAFVAFGLSYQEPGAPRYSWLVLLAPLAILQAVPSGGGQRLARSLAYLATGWWLLFFVPFVIAQVQSAIYPQLEKPGVSYSPRGLLPTVQSSSGRGTSPLSGGTASPRKTVPGLVAPQPNAPASNAAGEKGGQQIQQRMSNRFFSSGGYGGGGAQKLARRSSTQNLLQDPQAKVQTGPAQPQWRWNQVRCRLNGPVTATQSIRPIWISAKLHRGLTLLRVFLLLSLAAILLRRGFRTDARLPSGNGLATLLLLFLSLAPTTTQAQQVAGTIPSSEMLQLLRERLLTRPDAFPQAADIARAEITIEGSTIKVETEIHVGAASAVPLPGRLPTWSPINVSLPEGDEPVVCRIDNYLWIFLPEGIHRVVVIGEMPPVAQWDWTYLLKPRHVTVEAEGWSIFGLNADGVPAKELLFRRVEQRADGEASYDRRDFDAVVVVDRFLEIGLEWEVRTVVTRLSRPRQSISVAVPLLAGERVLSHADDVVNGQMNVRMAGSESDFVWESKLPVGSPIGLQAIDAAGVVVRWHLVASPVWNASFTGLAPIYRQQDQQLVPVWYPWPNEQVALQFSRPEAVQGPVVTLQSANVETRLGHRQRTTSLKLGVQSSLGGDFAVTLPDAAEVTSLTVKGQEIPVRLLQGEVVVPLRPGEQEVKVEWKTEQPLQLVSQADPIALPIEGANLTSSLRLPGQSMGALGKWSRLRTGGAVLVGLGSRPVGRLRLGNIPQFSTSFSILDLAARRVDPGSLGERCVGDRLAFSIGLAGPEQLRGAFLVAVRPDATRALEHHLVGDGSADCCH